MFGKKIEIDAPCKINLHLNVKGIRSDGYHDIESIFQLISLSDSISVSTTNEAGGLILNCGGMDLPEDNTVSRAVMAFREKTGIKTGLEINLTKRVPSGAGLGGGSSDGAAVLRALDKLFSPGLSSGELEKLALEIGSDAPFFIKGCPSFVSGRGEFIRRLDKPRLFPGVLIWPGVHSGTGEAYSLLDSSRKGMEHETREAEEVFTLLSREYALSPEKWTFFNSFTPVISEKYPPIKAAMDDIKDMGALFCEMSGSGASVFGIFDNEEKMSKAFRILSEKWENCYSFFLLAFSPMSLHN